MDNNDLSETVIAAQAGDQAALSRIYLEYAKPVYFLALKLLQHKEAAEDITQEVFVCVFQKIAYLREPGAFRVWLNRITANQCTNALTRNKEPFNIDIDEVAETDFFEESAPPFDPERALDNAETARMIADIVDALPTPQRACVYYYYYEYLTVPEIAEVMSANESTVKSRLALARDKIRKELVRLNEEEGIKLYGVIPFLLSPILNKSLQKFDIPQYTLQGMLKRITAQTGAYTAAPSAYTANSIAADIAATSAAAGKGSGFLGMSLGARIATVVGGAVVAAGVVFGGMAAVNALSNSVPSGITQEEFDRASAENAALRERLDEMATEPAATSAFIITQEPEPEDTPEARLEFEGSMGAAATHEFQLVPEPELVLEPEPEPEPEQEPEPSPEPEVTETPMIAYGIDLIRDIFVGHVPGTFLMDYGDHSWYYGDKSSFLRRKSDGLLAENGSGIRCRSDELLLGIDNIEYKIENHTEDQYPGRTGSCFVVTYTGESYTTEIIDCWCGEHHCNTYYWVDTLFIYEGNLWWYGHQPIYTEGHGADYVFISEWGTYTISESDGFYTVELYMEDIVG